MTDHQFGRFGLATGLDSTPHSLEAAQTAEALGYPAIWLSGGPLPGLQTITDLIGATNTIKFITGVLAIVNYPATDVAATYDALKSTGRFTVGLGGAHGPHPIERLTAYFQELDVPTDDRILAALGPRMLQLARDHSAGAFPFLVTPAYTAEARKLLGPDKLLAVSHLVVLETDPAKARAIARDTISFFPTIPAYAASLERQGFTKADQSTLPDHMVDALAAWGTPTEIKTKLEAHLAAGADHVALNVITGITGPQPIDQWRTLAPVLLT